MKVNFMVQRSVILLLMMVVFVGCGEDEPEKVKPKEVDEVADERPMRRIIWEKDGAKMVLIPAGSFEMGDHLDNWSNALPVHTVELNAFYMGKYEVTVGQYKQFVSATGHRSLSDWISNYSPTDNHPVVGVSWNDATAYAQWAGKRLPTEAEWEYAARGGLSGKRYPWGDKLTHDDANDWGTGCKDKWEYCPPVGSFGSNGYGLYDMAGNTWEWCADWYHGNYYSNSPTKDPLGPDKGQFDWGGPCRVLRGGSWNISTTNGRVAGRDFNIPSNMYFTYGFRCVSGLD